MKDVFISYAREEEQNFAIPLALALADLNITLWMDINELLVGFHIENNIIEGIETARFGIALLSENYFRKSTTLSELDLFLKKQKSAEESFHVIPIQCGHIKQYLQNEKYVLLANLLNINWSIGIENVITKVIKIVRPELLPEIIINDILLRNIPTPLNQLHAASFIRTYRNAGRAIEASQLALKYLAYYPDDPNILILYFNSAKATANKYIVEIAIIKIAEYLKSNPNNASVRENFISFLSNMNATITFQKIIIDDTSDWLQNNHNENIKKDYLTIVSRKGNSAQILRAIEEGKSWLKEKDNIQIRCALFKLIMSHGSPQEKENALAEAVRWNASDIENKDSNLLAVYVTHIKEEGNNEQIDSAIQFCENWTLLNPEDNFLLPPYLALIEKYNDHTYVNRAFTFIQNWLSFPFKDQATSINVRERFLKLIRSHGDYKQVQAVIDEHRGWLTAIKNVNSQKNVRAGLLNLVEQRGTDIQVIEEINNTLEWLNYHREETYVRSNLLNLVGKRCTEDAIKEIVFNNYSLWLSKNEAYEAGTEVRKRFIEYVLANERSCSRQNKIIEDNVKWSNIHKNHKVRKVLDKLLKYYDANC